MQFKPSKMMKVNVLPEQENQISTKEKIKIACTYEDVLAFDIYSNDLLVGFAMVRKFATGEYFLWNYAIDCEYKNQNFGTLALVEFIDFMKKNSQCLK